jgi:hypothetical protein
MIEYNEGVYLNLVFLLSWNWIQRLGALLRAIYVYAYIRVHLCAFVERSLCLWTRFILVLSLPSIACVSFSPSHPLSLSPSPIGSCSSVEKEKTFVDKTKR